VVRLAGAEDDDGFSLGENQAFVFEILQNPARRKRSGRNGFDQ